MRYTARLQDGSKGPLMVGYPGPEVEFQDAPSVRYSTRHPDRDQEHAGLLKVGTQDYAVHRVYMIGDHPTAYKPGEVSPRNNEWSVEATRVTYCTGLEGGSDVSRHPCHAYPRSHVFAVPSE